MKYFLRATVYLLLAICVMLIIGMIFSPIV